MYFCITPRNMLICGNNSMKSGTYLYADSISKTYPKKRRKVVECRNLLFRDRWVAAFGVFISVGGFQAGQFGQTLGRPLRDRYHTFLITRAPRASFPVHVAVVAFLCVLFVIGQRSSRRLPPLEHIIRIYTCKDFIFYHMNKQFLYSIYTCKENLQSFILSIMISY